jgi:purine-binding chemotaxis protein CheW
MRRKTGMSDRSNAMNQEINDTGDWQGKYLTFTLDKEDYGVNIMKVKEIIGMMKITAMPRTPAFIKGVINLRGKVIPVVDLRLKFGMEATDYTENTCTIVMEIEKDSGRILVGIVVDSVSEVLQVNKEDIDETPTFGADVDMNFILGMAKIGNNVKMLLDIDHVLNAEDVVLLSKAA